MIIYSFYDTIGGAIMGFIQVIQGLSIHDDFEKNKISNYIDSMHGLIMEKIALMILIQLDTKTDKANCIYTDERIVDFSIGCSFDMVYNLLCDCYIDFVYKGKTIHQVNTESNNALYIAMKESFSTWGHDFIKIENSLREILKIRKDPVTLVSVKANEKLYEPSLSHIWYMISFKY